MTRRRLVDVMLLVAGVAVLAAGIGFRVADFHVQTVLSGSMRPTVSPGDLAITQGVPKGSLRVGDVIVFTPPDGTQPVLHRIASREGDVLTTKGDANSVADPWRITAAGSDRLSAGLRRALRRLADRAARRRPSSPPG